MSIKIDEKLKSELKDVKSYVSSLSEEMAYKDQEEILLKLSLILNPEFRRRIVELRKKYKIPPYFYRAHKNAEDIDRDFGNKVVKWMDDNYKKAPVDFRDKRIIALCNEFNINPNHYSFFIFQYLFFDYLFPENVLGTDIHYAKREFNDKCLIETRRDSSADFIKYGYIKFFRDTKKYQMINFIKENWPMIENIQNNLQPYPHTKRYGSFKRDIVIYLLYQLGYKTPEIDKYLIKVNPSDELLEGDIRQTITDVGKRIKK